MSIRIMLSDLELTELTPLLSKNTHNDVLALLLSRITLMIVKARNAHSSVITSHSNAPNKGMQLSIPAPKVISNRILRVNYLGELLKSGQLTPELSTELDTISMAVILDEPDYATYPLPPDGTYDGKEKPIYT